MNPPVLERGMPRLPNELFTQIMKTVVNDAQFKELRSLSLVCHHVHNLALARLFHYVEMKSKADSRQCEIIALPHIARHVKIVNIKFSYLVDSWHEFKSPGESDWRIQQRALSDANIFSRRLYRVLQPCSSNLTGLQFSNTDHDNAEIYRSWFVSVCFSMLSKLKFPRLNRLVLEKFDFVHLGIPDTLFFEDVKSLGGDSGVDVATSTFNSNIRKIELLRLNEFTCFDPNTFSGEKSIKNFIKFMQPTKLEVYQEQFNFDYAHVLQPLPPMTDLLLFNVYIDNDSLSKIIKRSPNLQVLHLCWVAINQEFERWSNIFDSVRPQALKRLHLHQLTYQTINLRKHNKYKKPGPTMCTCWKHDENSLTKLVERLDQQSRSGYKLSSKADFAHEMDVNYVCYHRDLD